MLIARKTTQFEVPREGTHNAVLADVYDLGLVPGFEGKLTHKVRLCWLLEETNSQGKPLMVVQSYTLSLGERANLRKAVKSILGSLPEGDFDLELLIGQCNQLVIAHNHSNGKTYANVDAIMKPVKTVEIPRDFVRKAAKVARSEQFRATQAA